MESVLKYPGGKAYDAAWIVRRMPKHVHYVEPFAGTLAVLLATDPEGRSEVVNDLDSQLSNFWRVLQDPLHRDEFIRRAQLTPFSYPEWEESKWTAELDCGVSVVDAALRFFVRCRQSYTGAGKSFAPLSKSRTRRGMNEQVAAWLSAIDRLPEVAERLRRVVIFNEPATDVIRREDSEYTLFYCDPPYHPSTRQTGLYVCEMDDEQHRELLRVLKACKGKVMLSGYHCPLYDEMLAGWTLHERKRANAMTNAGAKPLRTECLWCNFKGD